MYDGQVVIYADILFLINFSLDYLCLFIACRLQNVYGKALRLLAASAFGGIYSFFPYIIELPIPLMLILHIGAAELICFISFGKRDLKKHLLLLGSFIVSSALMGGLITAIYNITGRYSDGAYTETDALSFCLICLLSASIAVSYGLICKKKIHTRSTDVRIYVGNEKISARLLCDSGNLVTEPFSSLPVIVVSASCLPYPYDMPESESFPLPIRIIPFSTSAGKSCFLGFRPDRIEIIDPLRSPKKVDAFIGIDTENRSYSGYDGLVPTSIL